MMTGIGSMYGLDALQATLPTVFGVDPAWSGAAFAGASVGLACGPGLAVALLRRVGARVTAMLGTVVWGVCVALAGVALGHAQVIIAVVCLAVGGAGVGAAYLTIVATVGPAFASRPLVGSALGPLGFACGTALFFASAAVLGPRTPRDVSTWVLGTGLVVVTLAVVGGGGMPQAVPGGAAAADGVEQRVRVAHRRLAALLFLNAFPGMLLIGVVIAVVTGSADVGTGGAEVAVAITMVALFLGGLGAPSLRRALGARRTFVTLLVVRGVLLIALPFVPSSVAALTLIAAVLIGHGAGFSLLPGIVRNQLPASFAAQYGTVLIAWGLAGVVGMVVAGVSVLSVGDYTPALVLAGVVALVAAGVLGCCDAGSVLVEGQPRSSS